MSKIGRCQILAFFVLHLLLLFTEIAYTQSTNSSSFQQPEKMQTSFKLAYFVPDGWDIEFLDQDDLNDDGELDTVMLLHERDIKKFKTPDDIDPSEHTDSYQRDTNPRKLRVLFGEGKMWRLVIDNTNFIPQMTANMDDTQDPFNGVTGGYVATQKGKLIFRLGSFSDSIDYKIYTFRWQNDNFTLIGYDTYSRHRYTGDETDKSYNFLTFREKIITENSSESENYKPQTIIWKNLKYLPLMTIDKINEGNISEYLKMCGDVD